MRVEVKIWKVGVMSLWMFNVHMDVIVGEVVTGNKDGG